MYGPTPKISISTSTPGPLPPSGSATNAPIEPPSGIAIVSERVVTATRGRLAGRRELLGGERDPVERVADPQINAVRAGVDAERRVRHVRLHERPVHLLVRDEEVVVTGPDVVVEAGARPQPVGALLQPRDERGHARARVGRPRGEGDRVAVDVDRLEVAAPGLVHRVLLGMVEADQRGAVAAGRGAHDRPALARVDRSVVRVDLAHELRSGRGLPVLARAVVHPLRELVAGAVALGADDDRVAARGLHRLAEPPDLLPADVAAREPVQEVDDGVVLVGRAFVARRKVDAVVDRVGERLRLEAALLEWARSRGRRGEREAGRDQEQEYERAPHLA